MIEVWNSKFGKAPAFRITSPLSLRRHQKSPIPLELAWAMTRRKRFDVSLQPKETWYRPSWVRAHYRASASCVWLTQCLYCEVFRGRKLLGPAMRCLISLVAAFGARSYLTQKCRFGASWMVWCPTEAHCRSWNVYRYKHFSPKRDAVLKQSRCCVEFALRLWSEFRMTWFLSTAARLALCLPWSLGAGALNGAFGH